MFSLIVNCSLAVACASSFVVCGFVVCCVFVDGSSLLVVCYLMCVVCVV